MDFQASPPPIPRGYFWRQWLKWLMPYLALGAVSCLAGFLMGGFKAREAFDEKMRHTLALSWGDGKYGQAFYGAHIFVEPTTNGYSVFGRVYVGRNRNYYHDCGKLAQAATFEEAVNGWGAVQWQADGLHVGRGTNNYFLPRHELEGHR